MNPTFPVSVKGIVVNDGRILLVQNERNEWELPGGRLERGESPTDCVVRELMEETGLCCTVEKLVDVWRFEVIPQKEVLIVAYLCACEQADNVQISDEHCAIGWFDLKQIAGMPIPAGYVAAIRLALDLAASGN